jgi:MoaA/NifB/PqqE/SkfB family radical SAM enzyme
MRDDEYLAKKMDLAVFKSVIDDAYVLGTRNICFCGNGEPLLHPELIKMCEYIKTKGMFCSITTNGELLTQDMAKCLIDLGVDALAVSLHAASSETHKLMHRINKESFQAIVDNLHLFSFYKNKTRKKKPTLILAFLISKINYQEVIKMLNIAIDVVAQGIHFENLLYCKRREDLLRPFLLDQHDLDVLKGLLVEAAVLTKQNRIITDIPTFLNRVQNPKNTHFLVKQARLNRCSIHADGLVHPFDLPYEMGNVNKQSFIKIWLSQEYINFRRNISSLTKTKGKLPNYAFCRRCNAPSFDTSLCTLQW